VLSSRMRSASRSIPCAAAAVTITATRDRQTTNQNQFVDSSKIDSEAEDVIAIARHWAVWVDIGGSPASGHYLSSVLDDVAVAAQCDLHATVPEHVEYLRRVGLGLSEASVVSLCTHPFSTSPSAMSPS
jgi:hypothetical protein